MLNRLGAPAGSWPLPPPAGLRTRIDAWALRTTLRNSMLVDLRTSEFCDEKCISEYVRQALIHGASPRKIWKSLCANESLIGIKRTGILAQLVCAVCREKGEEEGFSAFKFAIYESRSQENGPEEILLRILKIGSPDSGSFFRLVQKRMQVLAESAIELARERGDKDSLVPYPPGNPL